MKVVANTLAYYDTATFTANEIFIVKAAGASDMIRTLNLKIL
jgi:hypothetical protein